MTGITCFLIDDDIDDHEIFCTVLNAISPGSQCVIAQNGQHALVMLHSGEISPDIIFLDLNMPLMNGRQFLQEVNVRNVSQKVPLIVLTTSSDPTTEAEILSLGAQEFITKPDRFSEWELVLGQIIRKYFNYSIG